RAHRAQATRSVGRRSGDAPADAVTAELRDTERAMKIAALQMVSTPDVARNLDTAASLIDEAAKAGARLVALPEYFCLLGRRDTDKLAIAEADGDGPIQRLLADCARRAGVWLVGGTLPMRTADPQRVRNSCCVYAP